MNTTLKTTLKGPFATTACMDLGFDDNEGFPFVEKLFGCFGDLFHGLAGFT
jgi:hypothetical protein